MSKICLFIGGPYAGREIEVSDGLNQYTAVEFPPAGLIAHYDAEPPKTADKLPETHYQRGQIFDAGGNRHDVFVAPDVDAIQELMRAYTKESRS